MKTAKLLKYVFLPTACVGIVSIPVTTVVFAHINNSHDTDPTDPSSLYYDVKFFKGEGTLHGHTFLSVKSGKKFSELTTPTATKDNCYFKYWQNEDGTIINSETVINKNLNLTAIYSPLQSDVVIKFDPGAGELKDTFSTTKTMGNRKWEKVYKPIVEKSGAKFVGWYNQLTNKRIYDNDVINEDTTVVAKYTDDSIFSGVEFSTVYFETSEEYGYCGNTTVAVEKKSTFSAVCKPNTYNGGIELSYWSINDKVIVDSTIISDGDIISPVFKYYPYIHSDKIYCILNQNEYGYYNPDQDIKNNTYVELIMETGNVKKIPKTEFNEDIYFGSNVTSIPNDFLYGCSIFNKPITLPKKIQTIGYEFLNYCSAFNQAIILPDTLTKIGYWFMYACDNMTSTVTVNCPVSTLQKNGNATRFLTGSSYYSEMYLQGVGLNGKYAMNFVNQKSCTKIDSTSYFWRNIYSLDDYEGYTEVISSGACFAKNYIHDLSKSGICYSSSSTDNLSLSLLSSVSRTTADLFNFYFSKNITAIPANFLYNCKNFHGQVIVPENITSVGKRFMYNTTTTNSTTIEGYVDSSSSSTKTFTYYYKTAGFGDSATALKTSTEPPVMKANLIVNNSISAWPSEEKDPTVLYNTNTYTYGRVCYLYETEEATEEKIYFGYKRYTWIAVGGSARKDFIEKYGNLEASSTTYKPNLYYRYLREYEE